jgi:hypothetical protein
MTKEELVEKLKEGEVVVTFKKKDGTERVMKCTKSFTLIPEENHPKAENSTPKVDENGNPIISDLITVWDVEKSGWRSFDYKTLIRVGNDNNAGGNVDVDREG